jgi:hypothetical protein
MYAPALPRRRHLPGKIVATPGRPNKYKVVQSDQFAGVGGILNVSGSSRTGVPRMKTVSRDEFVALLRSRCSAKLRDNLPRFDVDMILGANEFAVREGDLVLPADWQRGAVNLLVLGSITCDGLIDVAREGSDEWGGSLWVFGDLRCRNFAGHYATPVVVDGNLTVTELAVTAFEDSMLLVSGDFTAHFFYGIDIWAEVGGRAVMEYGDGYALPLGYDNAAAQVINPRHTREESLALLNLDEGETSEELVDKMRRGTHFRAGGE